MKITKDIKLSKYEMKAFIEENFEEIIEHALTTTNQFEGFEYMLTGIYLRQFLKEYRLDFFSIEEKETSNEGE